MKKADAIKFFGSQAAIAEAIGISQPAVSKWEDPIPALSQIHLERVTLGALKADPECWPQSPRTEQAAA